MSIGCFHCQSINGSDPRCEDLFFNNFGDSVYESDCKSGVQHTLSLRNYIFVIFFLSLQNTKNVNSKKYPLNIDRDLLSIFELLFTNLI